MKGTSTTVAPARPSGSWGHATVMLQTLTGVNPRRSPPWDLWGACRLVIHSTSASLSGWDRRPGLGDITVDQARANWWRRPPEPPGLVRRSCW